MPTFLDLGLLEYVQIIFPFILIWVVTYSVLEWREILGKNRNLHAIIAFVLAMMSLFSPPVIAIVKYMTPWFSMLLIFALFLLMFFKFFGIGDEAITKFFLEGEYRYVVNYWILLTSLLVLGLAIGQVFFAGPSVYVGDGQQPGLSDSLISSITGVQNVEPGVATSRGDVNLIATIFHPKVLGMIFILIISALTIKLLAGESIIK